MKNITLTLLEEAYLKVCAVEGLGVQRGTRQVEMVVSDVSKKLISCRMKRFDVLEKLTETLLNRNGEENLMLQSYLHSLWHQMHSRPFVHT